MMNKILILIFPILLFASNSFYQGERDGYFYYKDPIIEEPEAKKKQKSKEQQIINTTKEDYHSTRTKMEIPFENHSQRKERKEKEKEYIDNIPWHDLDNLSADEYRRLLDTTREISVATPTKQYVKSYAALQKFWVDKSEKFAKVWSVANLENPDELIYPDFEFSGSGRKIRYKEKSKATKDFFDGVKSRMGFIVIIEDKNDKKTLDRFKNMYEVIKKKTGLEYKILDFYDVPYLVRKLKLSIKTLPENFILYRGHKNKEIYKRVAKGYASVTQIVDNAEFVFRNSILEKDKRKKDREK